MCGCVQSPTLCSIAQMMCDTQPNSVFHMCGSNICVDVPSHQFCVKSTDDTQRVPNSVFDCTNDVWDYTCPQFCVRSHTWHEILNQSPTLCYIHTQIHRVFVTHWVSSQKRYLSTCTFEPAYEMSSVPTFFFVLFFFRLVLSSQLLRWLVCRLWCVDLTQSSWLIEYHISCERVHRTRIIVVYPTISRLLKIIGLFCKRARLKRRYSAKERYNLKEPTIRMPIDLELRLWGGYDE